MKTQLKSLFSFIEKAGKKPAASGGCGSGAGGFKPGNSCARGGVGSSSGGAAAKPAAAKPASAKPAKEGSPASKEHAKVGSGISKGIGVSHIGSVMSKNAFGNLVPHHKFGVKSEKDISGKQKELVKEVESGKHGKFTMTGGGIPGPSGRQAARGWDKDQTMHMFSFHAE